MLSKSSFVPSCAFMRRIALPNKACIHLTLCQTAPSQLWAPFSACVHTSLQEYSQDKANRQTDCLQSLRPSQRDPRDLPEPLWCLFSRNPRVDEPVDSQLFGSLCDKVKVKIFSPAAFSCLCQAGLPLRSKRLSAISEALPLQDLPPCQETCLLLCSGVRAPLMQDFPTV